MDDVWLGTGDLYVTGKILVTLL